MKQITVSGLSIVAGLLLAASALGAVDLSSPKSAAKSFYEAMNAADSAAMRDCMLIEGDTQQQLAGAFIDVILSGKKLADSAKEKFGPTGEKIGVGALSREDAGRIDTAEQRDEASAGGDRATLQLSKQGKPLSFRKTPGGWKLLILDYAGAKPDNLPEQTKLLTTLATVMNDTSRDIAEGRFPTPADAEAAIQQRFSEVMMHHYHSPTTQNAK